MHGQVILVRELSGTRCQFLESCQNSEQIEQYTVDGLFEQKKVTQHLSKYLESRVNADNKQKSANFLKPEENPRLLTPTMSVISDLPLNELRPKHSI